MGDRVKVRMGAEGMVWYDIEHEKEICLMFDDDDSDRIGDDEKGMKGMNELDESWRLIKLRSNSAFNSFAF